MGFYTNHPARNKARQAAKDAGYPYAARAAHKYGGSDDGWIVPGDLGSTGNGCDDHWNGSARSFGQGSCQSGSPWTREHPGIYIDNNDAISAEGDGNPYVETLSLTAQRPNIVYCGVHANMCVLNRDNGIRAMYLAGKSIWVAGDLVDAMVVSSGQQSHFGAVDGILDWMRGTMPTLRTDASNAAIGAQRFWFTGNVNGTARKVCHHNWNQSNDDCVPDGQHCVYVSDDYKVVCHHTSFSAPCNQPSKCIIDGHSCLVLEQGYQVVCHHNGFRGFGGPGCDCTSIDNVNVKVADASYNQVYSWPDGQIGP
jgi:hypothetical protein